MQLGLRASLEKDTVVLWGQPRRNTVLAFEGAAVWVTSLWRYVCKGKGLLYCHQMPLPASAPSCAREYLAFQFGQKCLRRLSLSWTWGCPGVTLL